ncbi:NitT/TauT family transport system permease protein [Fulvimarina manganoxydans]|uniref:NitT/TauT family transport system permease protein n=1 Tax=Fulvimarina manganoxydans TaxID=937218 RepID=A0A1W2E7C8_9HYPH|nr:ABC transporter permease subunit [Fulvimarina manganoxydans]SMD05447.1 NitT/TauT family transport system permease protein [Fulvimarina manganoxydans]
MRLINRKPTRPARVALGALPFFLAILAYAIGSAIRRAENPADKLLPSFEAIAAAFSNMAFVADRRTGDYLLWVDTFASLERLAIGMAIAAFLALVLGLLIGVLPIGRALFSPFVSAFSLIPPITVLPILFIVLGLGEAAKIGLVVVGTAPLMIRALGQAILDIPREQIVKAETLGASTWQMTMRVILPQLWPHLIRAVRLGLVPAWIFLISAEAIASTEGLGYRIFLVRRYLAMDVIIPYVLWITLLAYAIDRALALLSKRLFGWAHLAGESL